MRQLSVLRFLNRSTEQSERSSELEVWDLFCGAGGFSCGARQAGHNVVFACDSDKESIEIHKLNHPDAVHWCCSLPREDIPFPTDGRKFHLHGSPPCQKFSNASGTQGFNESDFNAAKELIHWYLTTALSSGATTWSMEQVASASVIEIVEDYRKRNRRNMNWGVFKFDLLGVPQTRRRLIAGSPCIIAKLKRLSCRSRQRSVRDVIKNCKGTHIRNSKSWTSSQRTEDGTYIYKKASLSDCCHSVDSPSPTIVAKRLLTWVRKRNGRVVSHVPLSAMDNAALQTFPKYYSLPNNKTVALRMIGNAVPPLVAKLMLSHE